MPTATKTQTSVMREDSLALRPSAAIQIIKMFYETRRVPLCLWGSPGIGKSALVHQARKDLGISLIDLRAAQMDPTDVRGIPFILNQKTKWAIPDILPTTGKGILFLDELNRAPTLVQNAFLELIRDRKLGDFTLGDDWIIISACNRETDGGGVHRMTDALADRFNHQTLVADLEDWCEWAVKNDISPMTLSFLRRRGELFHVYDSKSKDRVQPTPRSWEHVSDLSKELSGSFSRLRQLSRNIYAGSVGHGAAIEYVAFEEMVHKLPSIDQIIMNPTKTMVPTDASALYAVAAAVGRAADIKTIGNCIEYLERLPIEYNVMGMRDMITRDDELTRTKEFSKWAIGHTDVTLGK
jgi:hypothetical protein